MSFLKKIWQNRQSEHPSRRMLTNVNTNDVMLVDVARSEGEVLAEGDAFDESNMNDLEDRIENAFNDEQTSINSIDNRVVQTESQLNGFYFGVTSDGKAGYKRGASSEVIPFRTTEVYYLGVGTSFNLKSKFPNDYMNFTVNNFVVEPYTTSAGYSGWGEIGKSGGGWGRVDVSGTASASISKNYSNGVLTCSSNISVSCNARGGEEGRGGASGGSNSSNCKAYLIVGEIGTP